MILDHRSSQLGRFKVAFLATMLSVLSPLAGFAAEESSPHGLAVEGARLSADEVADLEKKLLQTPDDLAARTQLLGFYFTNRSGEASQARVEHVVWIILNHPDSPIAGTPYAHINAILESDAYARARSAWMQQIELHENDALVHGNAAKFFTLSDRELAKELLEKASELDPADARWPRQLGQVYFLGLSGDSDEARANHAAYSLQMYEKALSLEDELARRSMLQEVAKIAFETADFEKARSYALEMVSEADESSWNYGNTIHHGNLILGRLALRSGDIENAKLHLSQAGKTPGSPQLNSFGPNMQLAKELLEHGETEAVLDFFELCRVFWQLDAGRLDSWAQDIRANRVPKFGANLSY